MTPSEQLPRRAGRPPSRVLSRQLMTQATLALLNSDGHDGFTMVALAKHLKVAPSALYNHVESKREVLVWVQDHLMGLVDAGSFESEHWDQALIHWAWSYRAVFASHAPLIPVIAVMPITDAYDTLHMYETVATGLLAGGWPEARIVPTITAVESFVYGSALDVSAPHDIFHTGALAGRFPVFTAAVTSTGRSEPIDGMKATTNANADRAFAAGLEALVTGLRMQLKALQPGTPLRRTATLA